MNPDCAACQTKRIHTEDERQLHHSLARHGYAPECGWTSEDARLAHEKEQRKK